MKLDPNTGAMGLPVLASVAFEPLTMISMALTAVGTAVGAAGTIAAGNQAKADSEFNAEQLTKQSNDARAAGSREMLRERRQKELVQSSLAARAAASGGDTTDPTIVNLAGGIEREGEIQALSAFSRGENVARGYEDQAAASIAKGKAAQRASIFKATSTILEGAGSLAGKYGKLPGGGSSGSPMMLAGASSYYR